jgi:4-hydroxybenzoate polyprenyltransferase
MNSDDISRLKKETGKNSGSIVLERDLIQSSPGLEMLLLTLRESPLAALNLVLHGRDPVSEMPFPPRALRYDMNAVENIRTLQASGDAPAIESALPQKWVEAILTYIQLGDKHAASTPASELAAPAPATSWLMACIKALRPHQWTKNVLVFLPILMAHQFLDPKTVWNTILAFLCFGLVASSIYLMNDLMDLHQDRRHETKRNRPFASGALPVSHGVVMIPLLLGAAVSIASRLPVMFSVTMVSYLVLNLGYTFYLKRKLLVDVMALSGAYTLRILAGNAAGPVEVSNWLLAFSMFLFLSLALVKRYVELDTAPEEETHSKRVMGRGYRKSDLDMISQLGVASGFSAVVVLALFIEGAGKSGLYRFRELIWLVVPIVLYVIGRIWMLAKRRELPDDPIMFIIRDWRSHLMAAIVASIIYLAV